MVDSTLKFAGRAVILTLALPFLILALPFLLIWACGMGCGRKREPANDDVRIIQEIHQGLLQMERRIESLETILLSQWAGEPRREPDYEESHSEGHRHWGGR